MIYFVILAFMLILTIRFDFNRSVKYKFRKDSNYWYNFALFILIAFSGLRYKVGGDSIAYLNFFDDIPFLWDLGSFNFAKAQFDPLWILFSSFSKSIVNDFTFFQIVHAIIVNSIVFHFIKKNTPYKFTCILIYYLIFYVYFNMEIMRESLSICIFLLGYNSFKEGKWVKYYIYATIAFLFHSSALILFIFPFVKNIKIRPYTMMIWLIIFTLVTFIPDTFKLVLRLFLFNERISSRFEAYSTIKSNSNGMLYLFAVYFIFPAICAFINEKRLDNNPKFRELYFAYFLLVTITVGFSGFNRFLNYMTPFMAIYFANFLNRLYRNAYFMHTRKILIAIFLIFSFLPKLTYYLSDTSDIVRGSHRYDMWVPYYWVFDKQENYERESLYDGLFNTD